MYNTGSLKFEKMFSCWKSTLWDVHSEPNAICSPKPHVMTPEQNVYFMFTFKFIVAQMKKLFDSLALGSGHSFLIRQCNRHSPQSCLQS